MFDLNMSPYSKWKIPKWNYLLILILFMIYKKREKRMKKILYILRERTH